jgi:hypothetical protein
MDSKSALVERAQLSRIAATALERPLKKLNIGVVEEAVRGMGTKQTCRGSLTMSAHRRKSDIEPTGRQVCF